MKKAITIIIDDDCEIFRSGLKMIFAQCRYTVTFKELARHYTLQQLATIKSNAFFFVNAEQYVLKETQALYDRIVQLYQNKIVFYYSVCQQSIIQKLFDHFEGISFIHKDATPHEFLAGLEQLIETGYFYCSKTLHWLPLYMMQKKETLKQEGGKIHFTPGEMQIISLICEEYTAEEIASKLVLSKRTVENQKTRIQEKMQVKNMAGIVKYACENKLVGKGVVIA